MIQLNFPSCQPTPPLPSLSAGIRPTPPPPSFRRSHQFTHRIVTHGGPARDTTLAAATRSKKVENHRFEKNFESLDDLMAEWEGMARDVEAMAAELVSSQLIMAKQVQAWYSAQTIQSAYRRAYAKHLLMLMKTERFLKTWLLFRRYFRRRGRAARYLSKVYKMHYIRMRFRRIIDINRAAKNIQSVYIRRRMNRIMFDRIRLLVTAKRTADHGILFGLTRATRKIAILKNPFMYNPPGPVVKLLFHMMRQRRLRYLRTPHGKLAYFILSQYHGEGGFIQSNRVIEHIRAKVSGQSSASTAMTKSLIRKSSRMSTVYRSPIRASKTFQPNADPQGAIFTPQHIPSVLVGAFRPKSIYEIVMMIKDLERVAKQHPEYLDETPPNPTLLLTQALNAKKIVTRKTRVSAAPTIPTQSTTNLLTQSSSASLKGKEPARKGARPSMRGAVKNVLKLRTDDSPSPTANNLPFASSDSEGEQGKHHGHHSSHHSHHGSYHGSHHHQPAHHAHHTEQHEKHEKHEHHLGHHKHTIDEEDENSSGSSSSSTSSLSEGSAVSSTKPKGKATRPRMDKQTSMKGHGVGKVDRTPSGRRMSTTPLGSKASSFTMSHQSSGIPSRSTSPTASQSSRDSRYSANVMDKQISNSSMGDVSPLMSAQSSPVATGKQVGQLIPSPVMEEEHNDRVFEPISEPAREPTATAAAAPLVIPEAEAEDESKLSPIEVASTPTAEKTVEVEARPAEAVADAETEAVAGEATEAGTTVRVEEAPAAEAEAAEAEAEPSLEPNLAQLRIDSPSPFDGLSSVGYISSVEKDAHTEFSSTLNYSECSEADVGATPFKLLSTDSFANTPLQDWFSEGNTMCSLPTTLAEMQSMDLKDEDMAVSDDDSIDWDLPDEVIDSLLQRPAQVEWGSGVY